MTPLPPTAPALPDVSEMDDFEVIDERRRVAAALAALTDRYRALNREHPRHPKADARAMTSPPAPPRATAIPRSPLTTKHQPPKGPTVETSAGTGKELDEFERTYFERLRLAAQIILDAAPDLDLVTDPLEAELHLQGAHRVPAAAPRVRRHRDPLAQAAQRGDRGHGMRAARPAGGGAGTRDDEQFIPER